MRPINSAEQPQGRFVNDDRLDFGFEPVDLIGDCLRLYAKLYLRLLQLGQILAPDWRRSRQLGKRLETFTERSERSET